MRDLRPRGNRLATRTGQTPDAPPLNAIADGKPVQKWDARFEAFAAMQK